MQVLEDQVFFYLNKKINKIEEEQRVLALEGQVKKCFSHFLKMAKDSAARIELGTRREQFTLLLRYFLNLV